VPVEHTNKSLREVPESEIHTVTLTEPLAGYCVEDTRVAHYVGPVHLKQDSEFGRRTIAILSYKPLVPLRPADVNATTALLRTQPDLLKEQPAQHEQIALTPKTTAPDNSGGGILRTDRTTTEGRLASSKREIPRKIILRRALY
jgi:hypothetical protein